MNQLKSPTSRPSENLDTRNETLNSLDETDRALLAMNFYEIERGGLVPEDAEFQYRQNRKFLRELADNQDLHQELENKLTALVSRDLLPQDSAEEILHILTADPLFRIHLSESFKGEEALATRQYQLITGSIAHRDRAMNIESKYYKRDLIDDLRDYLDNPNNSLNLVGRNQDYIVNAFITDSYERLAEGWKISKETITDVLSSMTIEELGSISHSIRISEAKSKEKEYTKSST